MRGYQWAIIALIGLAIFDEIADQAIIAIPGFPLGKLGVKLALITLAAVAYSLWDRYYNTI